MSKIFTRSFRVRWAELDPSKSVSPANYLRYIVETAWDWGTAIGWGEKYSEDPDVLWLLRETELRLMRPLRHNDEMELTIWLTHWQKVRGARCFEIVLKGSRAVVAQGTQRIVYVDPKTGRPIIFPEQEIERFRIENPRVFPFEPFPKIAPVENPFVMKRQVQWMDLDSYEHVNNVVYVNYAEEIAAQDFAARGWSPAELRNAGLGVATRRVHVQYLSVAVWGEPLTISTHMLSLHETGGSRYVGIARTDGASVAECILDWELVDRQSGQAQALPDGLHWN